MQIPPGALGEVAQVEEHLLWEQEVTSASLVFPIALVIQDGQDPAFEAGNPGSNPGKGLRTGNIV